METRAEGGDAAFGVCPSSSFQLTNTWAKISGISYGLRTAHRLKLLITYGGILLAKKDLQTLCPFVIRLVNEFGGDDVFLRLLLIRTFIATGQLNDAEAWLAPMRAYSPLQPIVEAAEQEMGKRRRDLGIA